MSLGGSFSKVFASNPDVLRFLEGSQMLSHLLVVHCLLGPAKGFSPSRSRSVSQHVLPSNRYIPLYT